MELYSQEYKVSFFYTKGVLLLFCLKDILCFFWIKRAPPHLPLTNCIHKAPRSALLNT